MNDGRPPPDHAIDEDSDEDVERHPELKDNLKSKSTWLRLLFMILFVALWSISRLVVFAVVVLQFFWVLFTGTTNARLSAFGMGLATYSFQIITFLTYNTDEQPFPFSDWPVGPPGGGDD
jgi:hypothetical protein